MDETTQHPVWYIEGTAPTVGVPVWHDGRVVVATGVGSRRLVDLDAFPAYGREWQGLDEAWCLPVTLRDATGEEAEPLRTARAAAEVAEAETVARRARQGALAAEPSLVSGRPISAGDYASRDLCEQLGIGQAVWHDGIPEAERSLKNLDWYDLTLDEAETLIVAFERLGPDASHKRISAQSCIERLRADIARHRDNAALLVTMTPGQRAEAALLNAEQFARGVEAVQVMSRW